MNQVYWGGCPAITCQFLTGESTPYAYGHPTVSRSRTELLLFLTLRFFSYILESLFMSAFFPPPYFVNPRRPPRCIFTFTPFLLILISADSLFPTYSQTNSHSLWTPLWMSSMIFLCDKLWELTPLWKTILEGIASKIISANLGQNVCWILI